MAVERSAAAILHWSWWRRWHQAWARSYHYRRRDSEVLGQSRAPAAERPAEEAQPQVMEVVWSRLEALLPVGKRVGRPYGHDRRVILNAIMYLMQTDCGWQHLPSHFPPWQTVYAQLSQWRTTGIWDTIWSGLDIPRPTEELQL